MTTSVARQIVLAARPNGRPKPTDFQLEETAIPTPAAGQLLLGVQYLSLDPYMRGRMDDWRSYATPVRPGNVMTGEAMARVLASKTSGRGGSILITSALRSSKVRVQSGPASTREKSTTPMSVSGPLISAPGESGETGPVLVEGFEPDPEVFGGPDRLLDLGRRLVGGEHAVIDR
jgi:NADPH-dependent curcumin reductase